MRRANDNYSTDPGLARWAVRHAVGMAIVNREPPSILEPCCGDTAPFATAGHELGFIPCGYDVRDVSPPLWGIGGCGGGQFKQHDVNYEGLPGFHDDGAFDVIATNPPFSFGEEVIRKSLRMLSPTGCAAFLVKLAFLSTQERSKLFVSRPPAEVWILRARPSFSGDGRTDVAQEYAFVFWHGAQLDAMVQGARGGTKLAWLDNAALMTRPGKRGKRVRVEKAVADE